MPHVSLRQKLLRGAYKYAAKLQRWRKREREQHLAEEVEITTGLGIGDDLYDQPLGQDEGEDSDVSSVSSASSIPSISSADSSYDFDIASMDWDLDTERETLYKIRYEAIRRHIERLENTRVVNPNTVHKLSQLYLVLEDYKTDDAKRFRRNLRVMPETFDSLVEKIRDHHIFLSEGSASQMPVDQQLAIALFRFGHFGNSASVESVAQWAGVSAGMVVNATRRVMVAFLDHHDEIIRWPNAQMKEEAKEWVEAASCAAWRDGWLFVDGTLVPLAEKPAFHGETYFDRKSNYSLNVQLITLPNLRIVDYVIGHTGSTHDSTAFAESRTRKDREQLLGPNEWIWADSAYPVEAWCVTPFKKPANNIPENKTFNYWVSHVRIRSEHAVGFLKGRFQSLRGLRQQIKNETDHLRALEWVRTCLVIHTLIQDIESELDTVDTDWEEELIATGIPSDSEPSDNEGPADAGRVRQRGETRGQRKRRKVKDALYVSGIAGERP